MSLGTTQNTSVKREKRRNIKTTNTINGSPDKKGQQGYITERMMAKRLMMKTERREPATRQRTTTSHNAMVSAFGGHRSFGSVSGMKPKPMMTSVLPENCALKALRAGSLVLNDRKLTLVDPSARVSNV